MGYSTLPNISVPTRGKFQVFVFRRTSRVQRISPRTGLGGSGGHLSLAQLRRDGSKRILSLQKGGIIIRNFFLICNIATLRQIFPNLTHDAAASWTLIIMCGSLLSPNYDGSLVKLVVSAT